MTEELTDEQIKSATERERVYKQYNKDVKVEEVMEREITEFAEMLYNFREAMDIKSIKANIKSFLLANHYRKLDPDQSLPQIVIPSHSKGIACPHCGEEFGIELEIEQEQYEAQEDMLKENWVKVLKEK